MKKIILAALGIAVVAAIWQLRPPPQVPHDSGGHAPENQAGRAVRKPHANPVAVPPTPPDAALLPAASRPSARNMIVVDGLPPVVLGNIEDAPWEAAVDAVVNRADLSETQKARVLVQMLPGLPEEAMSRAAEEASVRLPDSDYNAVMLPALLGSRTHGMAMSVFFADLMQRPAGISLPILLSIARDPQHAYSPFARENLELQLGGDFGGDWTKWEEAVRAQLALPGR